jgi:hypothetical protein
LVVGSLIFNHGFLTCNITKIPSFWIPKIPPFPEEWNPFELVSSIHAFCQFGFIGIELSMRKFFLDELFHLTIKSLTINSPCYSLACFVCYHETNNASTTTYSSISGTVRALIINSSSNY